MQHIGQADKHFAELLLIILNRRPVHHIQGIVQEMGMHLHVQRLNLGFLFLQLGLVILCHQQMDPVIHPVKALRQNAELIIAYHIHAGLEISFAHRSHRA